MSHKCVRHEVLYACYNPCLYKLYIPLIEYKYPSFSFLLASVVRRFREPNSQAYSSRFIDTISVSIDS